MKIIIIILQAILNLVRKRRDLIANTDKIPPAIKKSIIAWYSPKKQKLNNYDVIESYAEDFTRWRIDNTGVTTTQKKIIIAANTKLKYNIAYKGFGNSTDGFDIKYTGNIVMRYRYNKEDGTEDNITIDKSGIYHLPASVKLQKNFGFYCNPQTVTEEATIEILPTSILKDFSGNGLDAYMYGFTGKLNSGVGVYKIDFSKSQNSNAFDNFERFNNKFIAKGNYSGKWKTFGEYDVNGIVKNKVTIKITGLTDANDRLALEYGYFTTDGKYIKTVTLIDKDGVYTYDLNDIVIPEGTNIAHTIYNRMYFGEFIINDINLIVEEIPDYPNQLCYNGKSYAVAFDMPILTDYTVMAERTWFERQNRACFLSKITTSGTGAFGFEFYNEYNEDTTYSFGRVNNVEQFKDGITYQITNSYNGIVKLDYIVNGKDNAELYIGKLRPSERPAFIGCHGKIIIADRSFTEDEITWLKDNWEKI